MRGPQRFPGYLDAADNRGWYLTLADDHGVPAGDTSPADAWYRTCDRVRYEDRTLVHLGRLDHQTKVRGYRVELGEVEAAVRRHPAVDNVVAFVAMGDDGQQHMRTVYSGSHPIPADELDQQCRACLPGYMVPDAFHDVTELPLNPNGKTDRAAAIGAVTAPAGDAVTVSP